MNRFISQFPNDPFRADVQEDVAIAKPKVVLKRPPFYQVLLINDDYTPMDFVVMLLEKIFHKSHEEAYAVMTQVHEKGAGVCGVYTREVAETKVDQVIFLAREKEYPLQCMIEKE